MLNYFINGIKLMLEKDPTGEQLKERLSSLERFAKGTYSADEEPQLGNSIAEHRQFTTSIANGLLLTQEGHILILHPSLNAQNIRREMMYFNLAQNPSLPYIDAWSDDAQGLTIVKSPLGRQRQAVPYKFDHAVTTGQHVGILSRIENNLELYQAQVTQSCSSLEIRLGGDGVKEGTMLDYKNTFVLSHSLSQEILPGSAVVSSNNGLMGLVISGDTCHSHIMKIRTVQTFVENYVAFFRNNLDVKKKDLRDKINIYKKIN